MPGEVRLLILLGPTGTGKSELAVELAERLGGEIVGCDALQIYRGLDAATAKPGEEARRRVPHHLVDCLDPRTDSSMADYVREAERSVAEIAGRGRVPLVVGGSGLYLRGLLLGVIAAPGRDPALRERLRRIVARGGAGRLRHWLRRRDPESAARIPASDTQRLVRAVELARPGGVSWGRRLQQDGSWARGQERYETVKIGLDMEREHHLELLERRVERFFDEGLVGEVRALLREGIPPEANAFRAIGYREVVGAILRGDDPDGMRETVRRNTRRLAKRQRTWFRTEPDVLWLDAAKERAVLVQQVVERWRESIAACI